MKKIPLIDHRYILLLAFSRNRTLSARKKIDEIYKKKQEKYCRLYKNSEFFQHPYFDQFSTQTLIGFKKIVGIFLEAEQSDDYSNLLSIAKKMNNPLYRYFSSSKELDGDRMFKLLFSNLEPGSIGIIDNVTGVMLLKFLTERVRDNSNTIPVKWDWLMESLGVNTYIQQCNEPFKINDAFANKEVQGTMKQLTKEFRIKEANYSIDYISASEVTREMRKKIEENGYTENTIPEDLRRKYSKNLYSAGGNSALLLFLLTVTNELGFPRDAMVPSIPVEEWNRFLFIFSANFSGSGIEESEKEKLFWVCMYLFGMAREYRNTREILYDEISIQSTFFDKEDENSNTLSELKAAKKEIAQLKAEKMRLEIQLQQVHGLQREFEKERARLQQQIASVTDIEEKSAELRRFLLESESKQVEWEAVSFETQKELLSAQDIVIIGGQPSWIKRMKAVYPNFVYFHCDNLSSDLSSLNKKELKVFFQTAYNSHSMYERVSKQMQHNSKPLYYLNETGNVERTTEAMCRSLRLIEFS